MSDAAHHHAVRAALAQNNGLLVDAQFPRPFVLAGGGNSYDLWATTDGTIWHQGPGTGAYTTNAADSAFLYIDHYLPAGGTSYQVISHISQLTGDLRLVGQQGDITVSAPGTYTQTFTAPGGGASARFHFQCYQGTTCRIDKMLLKTA